MVECRDRHPRNSEGPFYVVNGECIACGAPESESDGLMSSDETGQCFFIRQPITEDEVSAAIRGVWANCCGAVRYGGNDPQILVRLARLGNTSQCDHEPDVNAHTQLPRNCVRFEYSGGPSISAKRQSLREILDHISEPWKSQSFAFRRYFNAASFRLRWGKVGRGTWAHTTEFRVTLESADRWLLQISGSEIAQTAFAIKVDKALHRSASFRNISWFAEYQLHDADPGQPHPY
jgi:hypothetical protein